MSGIGGLGYEGGLFCGLIGSSIGKSNINQFVNLIENVLDDDGAFVYLYNGSEEEPNIEVVSKLFQMDLTEKVKNEQIILINLKDRLKGNNEIDFKEKIDFFERGVNGLRGKGTEKIVIYGTRAYFNIKRDNMKELYKYHKSLKCLCKEKNIMVIIKYIVDDLSEKEFIKLISIHDLFILEGDKPGNTYTYLELISTSLIYLSKRQQNDEEYIREMKRIEYLKNLGELVEGVTHDFNNLLTTIIGFSQIALLEDTENQVRDYLNVIYNSAIDGKAMADKVHNYVKGSYNGEKRLHKINDLVRSSINMIKYKTMSYSRKTGNHIVLKEDLKSERSIYCNEFELRQVFLNILLNGLASMEGKGTLTVKTYDVNEKIYIEIIDTGCGMSERVMERIFEPFYTTKGKEGTGLGLNTAKKILESHSAEINVGSELGAGSVFTIVFSENIEEFRVMEEEIEDHSIYGAKVLVVDDKYSVAKSIAELIGLVNMTADVETKGEKVLCRLEEKTYDIIICDYSMPDIDGIEVSKLVKEKYPEKPFILLTGYSDKINEKYDTVDYVLKKPCTVEELADALGKSLNTVDVNKNKSYNIV